MKLIAYERKGPLINLIPILDSIFILIFIFMMALMQRVQRSEIKLTLPSTQQSPISPTLKSLSISLDLSGQIYLEERKVTLSQLTKELQILKLEGSSLPITIKGDKRVNLGLVIDVLDLAKKNGFRNVMIETSFQKNL